MAVMLDARGFSTERLSDIVGCHCTDGRGLRHSTAPEALGWTFVHLMPLAAAQVGPTACCAWLLTSVDTPKCWQDLSE